MKRFWILPICIAAMACQTAEEKQAEEAAIHEQKFLEEERIKRLVEEEVNRKADSILEINRRERYRERQAREWEEKTRYPGFAR